MHTSTWKQLERDVAEVLKGQRVWRGANFGQKDVDVRILDFPSLKVDTKRYKRFSIFSIYELVKSKYCKNPTDKPILVIRQSNKHFVLAVIDIKLLGQFLDYVREKGEQHVFNK